MATKSKEEDTTIDTTDQTGNFEQEYLEACKKLNTKPLSLLKFGSVPPPLPLKITDVESLKSTARIKSINFDLLEPMKSSLPTRRVINERREISIQEFLKKGQIDFGSATNLAAIPVAPKNNVPYQSRYKYSPTICMETLAGEEGGDEQVIFKIQMRGFKLDVGTFEVLNTIIPNLPNIVQINLWNCGMNDQHLNILTQIVSSGNIRQLCLDQNPMISELNYINLIGEDSVLRLLSLRGNNISDVGAKALANALKQNRNLLSLNLFDNKIQKGGAEALGEALKVNTTLQSLSLAKNHLGDEGIAQLCKALSNYPLGDEEVQNRKKQLSEIERIKNDIDEESKKKGARRGVASASKNEKDKKGNTGLKPKKPEPPAQRPAKTPDDPKIKKVAQTVDDKKGKKPPTATGKGKKGKEEDVEELLDVSQIEPMFEVNNQWYILGNRSLNSLNVSWNGITEMGIKYLYDAVLEQDQTADQAADGMLGLFKITTSHNLVLEDSLLLLQLQGLLLSRNPFVEPVDDAESEGQNDTPESQTGEGDDVNEEQQ